MTTTCKFRVANFLRKRSVQITLGIWIFAVITVFLLGQEGLPFNRPSLGEMSLTEVLVVQAVIILFVVFLLGVTWFITRKRSPPDFESRVPERKKAIKETVFLAGYGAFILFLGGALGIGGHLHGSIFGVTREVAPNEVILWTVFYFIALAVIPYIFFRVIGYNHRSLSLVSSHPKNDVLLILVLLAIQIPWNGLLTNFPIFQLTASQALPGIPLSFIIHLLGTGLPVMIYVQCLLVPRFLKIFGSVTTAVILGGFAYAGLHVFEYWTVYDSLSNATLSLIFVFFTFWIQGVIKAYLTLRTGNAWVHLWGYHAFVPHVDIDTNNIVDFFKIK